MNLYDIEKSVIGYFLDAGDAHTRIEVRPEWFASPVTRNLFMAFMNEDRANPHTLANKFDESLVTDCVISACSRHDLKGCIVDMEDSFRRNRATIALQKAVDDVRKGADIGESLAAVMNQLDDPSGLERTRDLSEILLERFRKIEAIQKGDAVSDDYIHTGYYDFDQKIGGYIRGDVTFIGGRPSMGKTSLALGSALYQARNGKRVLWFNMDSSEASIANRSFASNGASMERIRMGKPSADDWGRMATSHNIDKGMFIIDSTPGLTVDKLCSIARRVDRKAKVDVVYVDYMQQLAGADSEYDRVTNASACLKRLANELNVAMVPLVQLNRSLENRARDAKRPVLADLRSSGQIEQDGFMILYPYRDEVYEDNEHKRQELIGQAELLIRKHKDGPVGHIRLGFDADSARFVNVEKGGDYVQ